MRIEGRTALVTGANRGIGKAFVQELLSRGATVYAAARDLKSITDDGVIPVALDVADPGSIAAAAALAGDVSILVNNAGLLIPTPPLETTVFDDARKQFEVNCLGTWAATQAFAPVIVKNGGGAVVNMLSVASWASSNTDFAGYTASKAAQWAITNALRHVLRPQGVQVVGVHVGWVDTDLASAVDAAKTAAEDVARIAVQGLVDDQDEVLVDARAKEVKASLSSERPAYLPPERPRA